MAKNYAKRDFKNRSSRRSSSGGFGWLWLITGLLLGLFGASLFFLKKHVVIVEESQAVAASSANPAPVAGAPTPSKVKTKLVTKKAATDGATANSSDVKYDFYTMLPKMQVQNGSTQDNATPPPPKPTKPLAEAEQSMLTAQSMATAAPPAAATPSTTAATATSPTPATKAASATPATKTAVAPVSPTATNNYLVDLGSFDNFEKADARKASLIMAGISNAKIESTIKDGVTWYRVIVGPFKNRASAEKVLATAQGQQISGTIATVP